MLKLNHKDLDVWIRSKDLVKEIYRLCEKLPKDEKYILAQQMKRASISFSSNIAEGFARKSNKETRRFLDIARSSIVEVDTQIELCVALKYLSKEEIENVDEIINHSFAMITNLIKKIN